MSFLNRDNFQADAMMEMDSESDVENNVQQQPIPQKPADFSITNNSQAIGIGSKNLMANKVQSPIKQLQKTSDTSVHHQSQNTGVVPQSAFTPKYTSKQQNIQQEEYRMDQNAKELYQIAPEGYAIRDESQIHLDCRQLFTSDSRQIQSFVRGLTDLVKDYIQMLYPQQFKDVTQILNRAFEKSENNSLLLLSRTKQTIHAFLNAVEKSISMNHQMIETSENKKHLRVVRVNSILNNSEGKILSKFCEALDMKSVTKNYTVEMIDEVQKYFQEQEDLCLVFILEDIDYYIESTKQMMLYKILDMLQYCKIPFVFLATSQKVDIVDSFEKRIKSRFSHRQILFYEEKLEDLTAAVKLLYQRLLVEPAQRLKEQADALEEANDSQAFSAKIEVGDIYQSNDMIMEMLNQESTVQFLQNSFDCGKSYEYINQQLRIVLSNVDQAIRENNRQDDPARNIAFSERQYFILGKYQEAIDRVETLIYQAGEPATVIVDLPKSSLTVLITARKVANRNSLFNFESVYQKYRTFMMAQQKSQAAALTDLSRQTFLKIFLDLVTQGFLRSDSATDILSQHNKVALGFRGKDFDKMLIKNLHKMDLSQAMTSWATSTL